LKLNWKVHVESPSFATLNNHTDTPIPDPSDKKAVHHPDGEPAALLDSARRVITFEARALDSLADRLDASFLTAIRLLSECVGKVVVSGLGKSGIAGRKIAATLAATGAPSLFLHSGEAVHGDMGVIAAGDVVIAISYSGETRELIEMLPRLKVLGVPVIALTGKSDSALARLADCSIDASVESHPWPYGLIPTTSNAVVVAIGDALAIALLVSRGIREEDFALLHPGGLLGRKVLLKVGDLMHSGSQLPVVAPDAGIKAAIMAMTAGRLGAACIAENGRLLGIITDGDLRRLLERSDNPFELTLTDVMTRNPKTVPPEQLAATALRTMESHSITSLPVVTNDGELVGLIHMHDIVKLETSR